MRFSRDQNHAVHDICQNQNNGIFHCYLTQAQWLNDQPDNIRIYLSLIKIIKHRTMRPLVCNLFPAMPGLLQIHYVFFVSTKPISYSKYQFVDSMHKILNQTALNLLFLIVEDATPKLSSTAKSSSKSAIFTIAM